MLACARADFEEFRDKVKTNLKAGKVRLVLIADRPAIAMHRCL